MYEAFTVFTPKPAPQRHVSGIGDHRMALSASSSAATRRARASHSSNAKPDKDAICRSRIPGSNWGPRDEARRGREVTRRLGICTATIYSLCARGELPHVRILNAINVAPADLAAFVARHHR